MGDVNHNQLPLQNNLDLQRLMMMKIWWHLMTKPANEGWWLNLQMFSPLLVHQSNLNFNRLQAKEVSAFDLNKLHFSKLFHHNIIKELPWLNEVLPRVKLISGLEYKRRNCEYIALKSRSVRNQDTGTFQDGFGKVQFLRKVQAMQCLKSKGPLRLEWADI